MSEYIERGALLALLEERRDFLFKENGDYDHYSNGFDEAVDKVENFPVAADVVEVKHGRWEKVSWWQHQNRYECNECSICGCRVKPKFTYNYCPNCGAKMDGGKDNG